MSESEDSIPKKRLNKWKAPSLIIVWLIAMGMLYVNNSNSPTPSSPKIDNVQTKKKIEDKSAQVIPTEKPLPKFEIDFVFSVNGF